MICAAEGSTLLPLCTCSSCRNALYRTRAATQCPFCRCRVAAFNIDSRRLANMGLLIARFLRNCLTSSLMLSGVTMMVKVTEADWALPTLSTALALKVMGSERHFRQEMDRLPVLQTDVAG
jgi:hypothetical protein